MALPRVRSTVTAIEIDHLDPWLKQPADDRAIDSATLVSRYGLFIGIDTISEAVFLRGPAKDRWELWAVAAFRESDMDEILRRHSAGDSSWRAPSSSRGLVAAGVGKASPRDAAKYFFDQLQRATVHYSVACAPFGGGLLSAGELSQIVDAMSDELERNRQAALALARENPIAIIEAARELNLSPRPAWHHEDAWMANCPSGRQHWIMISASSNEFGCGYCGRSGGPTELRQFCEAVRASASEDRERR
jgi:hypothetical protein